jgi:hypothetical protein
MAGPKTWRAHKVESLTSGQPYSQLTFERHHHYRRGESNERLREAILAGLPSWEEENRQLNEQLKAAGQRA